MSETSHNKRHAEKGPYDDIIDLPHHTSPTRPRMSMEARAAQFAAFAAVSGHEAAIAEAAWQVENSLQDFAF